MFRISLFLGLLAFAFATPAAIEPRTRVPMPDGRIVGGESANIADFPHQVSVRIFQSHICGGSIITPSTILTAAHCIVADNPAYYTIQYGKTVTSASGSTINVKKVIVHSNYDPNTIDYDVALIICNGSIDFNANVQPISLATESPAAGTKATVTGWGTTSENGSSSTALQQVQVEVVDRSECNEKYKNVNAITERMLCAGVNGGGKDACQGDSGGPLITNYALIGIVSWGVGCARADYPGVYTNVAYLLDWINANSL